MALDRGVWIDHGQDPAYGVLAAELVSLALFDIRDPRLTGAYLRDVLTRIPKVGLYACSQGEGWPDARTVTPAEFAKWTYDRTQAIATAVGAQGSAIRVCLNCETHDVPWILAMLKRWRAHSPRRVTAWSMEANQAALFEAHALELRGRNVIAAPQCYVAVPGNPMARVESAHEQKAWAAIVGGDRVAVMLDGLEVGHWWEGIAFTQGRLLGRAEGIAFTQGRFLGAAR